MLASRLAQLTPQQFRVLLCLADGLLNKQIAYELGLAENTVKVHVTAILKKLECHSRTQAAVLVKALEPEGDPRAGWTADQRRAFRRRSSVWRCCQKDLFNEDRKLMVRQRIVAAHVYQIADRQLVQRCPECVEILDLAFS